MRPRAVALFEEHGEVLELWRALGLRQATVVCLDRHLDLKAIRGPALDRILATSVQGGDLEGLNRRLPFEDNEHYAFGLDSFLYAAIRLGMIGRLIWVRPDTQRAAPTVLRVALLGALSMVAGHADEVARTLRTVPGGAMASIAGAEVGLTTLRLLPQMALPKDTIVDVDLDFFATEDGVLLHSPDEAVEVLRQLGLGGVSSMTASVSSGFLPPGLRNIGARLGEKLGLRPERRSDRRNPAAGVLRRLATGAVVRPADAQRLAGVLPGLGPAGFSLLSVVHDRAGDLDSSEAAYWRARDAGDGAHWAAYKRGLTFLGAGDPNAAQQWFSLARGCLTDSLQLHSASLFALSLARAQRWEEALAAAIDAARATPLRREPFVIGAIVARQLGHTILQARFEAGGRQITELAGEAA